MLPCHNSWLCFVLAQAHFTHFNTMHAHVEDTSLVGRWEEGLAAVSLQYIFTIFLARVSGHWLSGFNKQV